MTTVAAPTKFQQLRLKNNTPTAAPMPLVAGADGKVKYAILGSEGPVVMGGPQIGVQSFSFAANGAQTLTPQHLASGLLIVSGAANFTTPTAQQIINFFQPSELMPGTTATIDSFMGSVIPSTAKTLSAGLPLLVPFLHLRVWQTGAAALTLTGGTDVVFLGTGAGAVPVVGTQGATYVSSAAAQKIDVFFYVMNYNPTTGTAKVGFVAM